MRPPKVLIAILGLDQHEVGAIAVLRLLRDAGMEVIYLGRFQLPADVVAVAVEEDVDVIGLSCHSWEYLHYLDELLELTTALDPETPVIVGGSIITPRDAQNVLAKGIAAAFGPGVGPEEIVSTISAIAAR